MTRQMIVLFLCFAFHLTNAGAKTGKFAAESEKPKLVLVMVVDQMRADHLTRFAGVYRHGFARLAREGAQFSQAYHHHAYTVTAVGHSTIATGSFPARHGIVGNDWYDFQQAKSVYCAEDSEAKLLGYPDAKPSSGRSPRNLLTSTSADWIKASSPQSKVFGVARKDRAAILSTGKKADGAFWFNGDDGNFITSDYYGKKAPEWLEAFNSKRAVDRYLGKEWRKDRKEETYFLAREDTFASEANGVDTFFPHALEGQSGQPDKRYYARLQTSPYIEKLVLELVQDLIEAENIGSDSHTDFLFVGFSGADDVGHSYGPLSQESMDYFMHLDQYLGDFLSYLDEKVGRDNYLTILSSDHGVLPMPEELARRGFDSKRIPRDDIRRDIQNAQQEVMQELGLAGQLILRVQGYSLFVNYDLAEKSSLSPAQVDQKLAATLEKIPYIAGVFTKEQIAVAGENASLLLQRAKNSYQPDRSGDLHFRLQEHYLVDNAYGTSHGSTYDYDAHVPILFIGKGIANKIIDTPVHTVDIAPTIADWLGIRPGNEIDGKSFAELIKE